jgi:hypothetical protein
MPRYEVPQYSFFELHRACADTQMRTRLKTRCSSSRRRKRAVPASRGAQKVPGFAGYGLTSGHGGRSQRMKIDARTSVKDCKSMCQVMEIVLMV